MTIIDWPVQTRPREKLLLKGERHLSDAELLAIFFRTGIRGKTAVDLAQELLLDYGSIKKLLNSHAQDLLQKRGIGKTKYVMLKAAIEIGRRYFEEEIPLGESLKNSELTKRFLTQRLKNYPHEVFACLFLDNHHRLICFEELFHGTLTEANVYPREIVKRCLAHNAAKIILAHNHPSGNAEPSDADREVTQLLKRTLALIDVQVIDHLIVGREIVSFAENGWI